MTYARLQPPGRIDPVLFRNLYIPDIDHGERVRTALTDAGKSGGICQNEGGSGVVENIRKAFIREGRIQAGVGGAGLEDCKLSDEKAIAGAR
jgi:hypothetical protein